MARRLLVVEAILTLAVARLAIAVLPFRSLQRFLTRDSNRAERSGEARNARVASVRAAIESAARRLPGQTVCFPRAVAAQSMLRRRGIGTTLYYGAARSCEEGLIAHVWLQDRDTGILGHELAPRYKVLAQYTAGPQKEGFVTHG